MQKGDTYCAATFTQFMEWCEDLKAYHRNERPMETKWADDVKQVIIQKYDHNSSWGADWIMRRRLSKVDKTDNPVMIIGADPYDAPHFKEIIDYNCKGIMWVNVSADKWSKVDADVTYIDCPGAPA